MRMSDLYEGHACIPLVGKRLKPGVVVGDYCVEVTRRAGPLCKYAPLKINHLLHEYT